MKAPPSRAPSHGCPGTEVKARPMRGAGPPLIGGDLHIEPTHVTLPGGVVIFTLRPGHRTAPMHWGSRVFNLSLMGVGLSAPMVHFDKEVTLQ